MKFFLLALFWKLIEGLEIKTVGPDEFYQSLTTALISIAESNEVELELSSSCVLPCNVIDSFSSPLSFKTLKIKGQGVNVTSVSFGEDALLNITRGNLILESLFIMQHYEGKKSILIETLGRLELKDVRFTGISTEKLISAAGSIKMQDVYFYGINSEEIVSLENSDFTYERGELKTINSTRFLNFKGSGNVSISEVNFTQVKGGNRFIWLRDFEGNLKTASLSLKNFRSENIVFFQIETKSNSAKFDFRDLTVGESVIGALVSFMLQNSASIAVDNLRVTDSALLNYPISVVYPIENLDPSELKLSNITLSSTIYTGTFLSTYGIKDVSVSNFDARNIGEYSGQPELKFLSEIDLLDLEKFSCNSFIIIQAAGSVQINQVSVNNMICSDIVAVKSKYLPEEFAMVVSVFGSENLSILDLNLSNIKGDPENGLAFNFNGFKNLDLEEASFKNLTSEKGSIGVISSVQNVTIRNFKCEDCSGNQAGNIYIQPVERLLMENFTCNNCESKSGNGGALALEPSTYRKGVTLIELKDCFFRNCKAEKGQGGAVLLNSFSSELLLEVEFENMIFETVTAERGSGIYINELVNFKKGMLKNIRFYQAHTTGGAPIEDSHSSGTLEVSGCFVENSTGDYCFLKGSYSKRSKILEVTDFEIEESKCDKSSLLLESSQTNTKVVLQNLNFTRNSNILDLRSIQVEANNFVLKDNSGYVVSSKKGSSLNFQKLHIEKQGGPLIEASESFFKCTQCSFKQSIGAFSFQVTQNSAFSLSYFEFTENSFEESGILVSNSEKNKSFIENSVFKNNYSEKGSLINLGHSNLEVSNSSFEKNLGGSVSSGLAFTNSRSWILNSNFSDSEGQKGGFIYALESQHVEVTGSKFNNGKAKTGGAIALVNSDLLVRDSEFKDHSAEKGEVIWGIVESSVDLKRCKFTNSVASDLAGVVYNDEGKLQVEETTITVSSSSAFYLQEASNIFVKDSSFEFCSAEKGSAIYLKTQKSLN